MTFWPSSQRRRSTEAEDVRLKAVIEAIIYVTDEPLTLDQISAALEHPRDRVARLLEQLAAEYEQPERGLSIREVAGGYKISTKAGASRRRPPLCQEPQAAVEALAAGARNAWRSSPTSSRSRRRRSWRFAASRARAC